MKYDFAAIEKKWQDKWEQEKPYAAVTGDPRPKFYGAHRVPVPLRRRVCTSAIRAPIRPWTSSARKKRHAGLQRPRSPSALTPSACRRRTTPSRTTSIPPSSRKQNIDHFTPPAQDARLRLRLGPRGRHHRPQLLQVDAVDLPADVQARPGLQDRRCPSTGARAASACWQTRRSSRAFASAAAARSSARKRASGCCASRTTPRPPDRRSGRCGLHRARQDPAAQLDRPLHRRGGRPSRPTPATISPSTPPVPDTLFGATYMVISPEHPLLEKWQAAYQELGRGRRLSARPPPARATLSAASSTRTRPACASTASRPSTPSTARTMPMFVSDYVLMGYGTGVVMGVPGHDQRDWEFATEVRSAHRRGGRGRRRHQGGLHASRTIRASWSTPASSTA